MRDIETTSAYLEMWPAQSIGLAELWRILLRIEI